MEIPTTKKELLKCIAWIIVASFIIGLSLKAGDYIQRWKIEYYSKQKGND